MPWPVPLLVQASWLRGHLPCTVPCSWLRVPVVAVAMHGKLLLPVPRRRIHGGPIASLHGIDRGGFFVLYAWHAAVMHVSAEGASKGLVTAPAACKGVVGPAAAARPVHCQMWGVQSWRLSG